MSSRTSWPEYTAGRRISTSRVCCDTCQGHGRPKSTLGNPPELGKRQASVPIRLSPTPNDNPPAVGQTFSQHKIFSIAHDGSRSHHIPSFCSGTNETSAAVKFICLVHNGASREIGTGVPLHTCPSATVCSVFLIHQSDISLGKGCEGDTRR